ncbi:MAG: dynamin family protein, partial [Rhodococcus sp. (in: high G+C Gram-positive bacteria)]
MTALAEARALISAAREAYSIDHQAAATLTECLERLDQPLRVALAGSLKAGKSTLLNALVGQDIAPTDATECTKVVTWYRSGSTPSVTAWYDGDRSAHVPVQRRGGRLTFDLGELTAAHVDRLDVEWPARTLTQTTIIDTPGTSSLSRDVSARTLSMLTPENASSGADAVVYLLRTLNATDVSFLGQISSHVGGEAGPLGVIGVVSRADEVGAGRMDAMMSAKEVAARFAAELEATGLCQAVVPVAGLLALGAETLRQSEFAA